MPQHGYTYTPEYTDGVDGSSEFTGNGTLQHTSSKYAGQHFEGVYQVNDLTGEETLDIDESDYQQDADYQPDNDAEYAAAVLETYPQLPQALQWVAETMDPDLVAAYNEAVDQMDFDEFMPLVEQIMETYYAEFGYEPQSSDEDEVSDDEVDDSPVDQEEVDSAFENLQNQELLGDEAAYEFMEAAVEAKMNNDDCLSDALQLTAQFHRGVVEPTEAITEMMDKYSMQELRRIYRLMTQEG